MTWFHKINHDFNKSFAKTKRNAQAFGKKAKAFGHQLERGLGQASHVGSQIVNGLEKTAGVATLLFPEFAPEIASAKSGLGTIKQGLDYVDKAHSYAKRGNQLGDHISEQLGHMAGTNLPMGVNPV